MSPGSMRAQEVLRQQREQADSEGWEQVFVLKGHSAMRYYRDPSGYIRLQTYGEGSVMNPGPAKTKAEEQEIIRAKLTAAGWRREAVVDDVEHQAGKVPWGAEEIWVK